MALECKYCLCQISEDDNILYPCKCTAPVHKHCLLQWLETRHSPFVCEICKEEYTNIRVIHKTIVNKYICVFSLAITLACSFALFYMLRTHSYFGIVGVVMSIYVFISVVTIGHILFWRVNNTCSLRTIRIDED